MKNKILVWILLLSVFAAWGQSGQEAVERFAKGGSVDPSSVAVLVKDLATGETVGSWQPEKPLVPASVMKCVTTATLLEDLGRDWTYETKVYAGGKIKDGVLHGNLVVVASGDPSLGTVHAPGSTDILAEITDALRDAGIWTIEGDIVIDESRFAGPVVNPRWMSADLPHAYGTGTHGFNYEDNASGKSSVANPSAVFINRLRNRLRNAGITVAGNSEDIDKDYRKHGKLLLTHTSEPLSEIMRSCMMRSDNQFAEGLLRTVGAAAGKDGSVQSGADEAKRHWKKRRLPTAGVEIYDGSGLSRDNRLTAAFLAGVLEEMSSDPYYASFFPLAGQEGTLRRFLAATPLEGYVAMKTGSMRGIQCYAGYKVGEDYEPTHVIVVMINNMGDRGRARSGVQKMLEEIFLDN